MHLALSVLVFGAALVVAPRAASGSLAAALALVPVGAALAVVAAGGRSPLAVAAGALGALAYAALAPLDAALAGAALVVLALAPRCVRARSPRARGVYGVVALATGLAAGWVAARHAWDAPAAVAAAALVAGVLASAVVALPADDAVTHALLGLAQATPEPARTRLLRAALLRRRADGAREDLAPGARRSLEGAWRALVAAGQARVLAREPAGAVLDARIAAHLDALERAYAAADERLARAAGLADGALAAARIEADTLATEASALAEVGAREGDTAPAARYPHLPS